MDVFSWFAIVLLVISTSLEKVFCTVSKQASLWPGAISREVSLASWCPRASLLWAPSKELMKGIPIRLMQRYPKSSTFLYLRYKATKPLFHLYTLHLFAKKSWKRMHILQSTIFCTVVSRPHFNFLPSNKAK